MASSAQTEGAFNPGIPAQQEPTFWHWSKAPSQPIGDTSAGEALSGVGHAVDATLKTGDWWMKDHIKDDVFNQVDQERRDYIAGLETQDIKNKGQPGSQSFTPNDVTSDTARTKGAMVAQAPMNLLSQPTDQKLPGDLDNLPNRLSVLDGARENGKLSETAYYGRLDALLKDLRSRYPGYRDYVDEQVKHITGVDPANAYIKSLVGDINSFQTQMSNEKKITLDAIDAEIKKGLFPGMAQVRDGFVAGKVSSSSVWGLINKYTVYEHQLDQAKKLMEGEKLNNELKTTTAQQSLTKMAGVEANRYMDTVMTATGISASDVLNHKVPISDQAALLLGQQLEANRNLVEKLIWTRANQADKNGETLFSQSGADKAKQIVKDQMMIYDSQVAAIKDNKLGLAVSHKEQAEAALQDNRYTWYKGPIGSILLDLETVSKHDKVAGKYLEQVLGNKEIDGLMVKAIQARLARMATQSTEQQDGKPTTLNQVIDEFRHDMPKLTPQSTPAEKYQYARTFNHLVDQIQIFADPGIKPDTAKNLAKALYSDGNLPLVRQFERNPVDPVTGKSVPGGQYSVYGGMTSDKMLKKAHELGNESWSMAKNWTENTFNDLNQGELQRLNQFKADPNVTFAWDDVAHTWKAEYPERTITPSRGLPSGIESRVDINRYRPGSPERDSVEQSVSNLNKGIGGLVRMMKEDGASDEQINERVFGTLLKFGLSGDSLPKSLANSILAKKLQEKREQLEKEAEDRRKALSNP